MKKQKPANEEKQKAEEKKIEDKKETKVEEKKTTKSEEKKSFSKEDLEKINLSKWNNSLLTQNKPSLEKIEINSTGSLEKVVEKVPIKQEEKEEEEFKYSLSRGYNEKKDNYSSSQSKNYSNLDRVNPLELGKNHKEFSEENIRLDRKSGDFFGVKEERDYKFRTGDRIDPTKRKDIFEMEREKLREIGSQRDYDNYQAA